MPADNPQAEHANLPRVLPHHRPGVEPFPLRQKRLQSPFVALQVSR